MPLLIDCYNLLHAPMPPSLAGLEEDGLCRRLAASPWAGQRIAVVCDGGVKPGTPAFSPVPQVELIYSGPGRSADDVIIELIDADHSPRRLYVVTDDREIQKAARRRRCQVLGTASFIGALAAVRAPAAAAPDALSRRNASLSAAQVDRWLEEFGVDPDAATADLAADDDARPAPAPGAAAPPADGEMPTLQEKRDELDDDEITRWLKEFGVSPDKPIDPREKQWWEGG